MKKVFLTTLFVLTMFSAFLVFAAGENSQSRYKIFSRSIRVGDFASTITHPDASNPKILKFVSICNIKANFIVYSYALENREEALVGEEGTISYLKTEKENENKRRIEGKLIDGKFQLQVLDNGHKKSIVIDRAQYDFTTM